MLNWRLIRFPAIRVAPESLKLLFVVLAASFSLGQPGLAQAQMEGPAPARFDDASAKSDLRTLVSTLSLAGWISIANQLSPQSTAETSEEQRAAILNEFGLIGVIRREFARGQRHVFLDVYDFQTSDGAYAAYNLLRQGASTVVRRGDASSEEDQSISFWKDKYFVRVLGTAQDDDESQELIKRIADQLELSIPGHAQLPAAIARLPVLEKVRGSEKLVMGPTSARRFFPAPYIGSLTLDRVRAAVADYQLPSLRERLKLMCVSYADPDSAARAYGAYLASFNDVKTIDTAIANARLFKVGNGYMFCQQQGPQVILITGAHKKFSPQMLARQIN